MKFLNLSILCLLIVFASSVKVDYVVNGNFSYNLCPKTYCIWNTSTYNSTNIYGWLPDPQIEIGKGSFYSANLGTQKVLELAGSKNTCVKQIFDTLNAGSYNLTIFYTAHKNKKFEDCQFTVYFNNKEVSTILPNSYLVVNKTISLRLSTLTSNVELKLCGSGTFRNDGLGAILTKVTLQGESTSSLRRQDSLSSQLKISSTSQIAQNPTNLLVDGNLSQHQCKQSYCIWNTSTYKSTYIPGWYPEPEIQIGNGNVYNSKFPSTTPVLQLSGNKSTCVKQTITGLNVGSYQLYFDWAARNSVSFSDCSFSVYMNSQILEKFVPADYLIHDDVVDFNVDKALVNPVIKFCSSATSARDASLGVVVTNFRLYQLEFEKGSSTAQTSTVTQPAGTTNTATQNITFPSIPNSILNTTNITSSIASVFPTLNTTTLNISTLPLPLPLPLPLLPTPITLPNISSTTNYPLPTYTIPTLPSTTTINTTFPQLPTYTLPTTGSSLQSIVNTVTGSVTSVPTASYGQNVAVNTSSLVNASMPVITVTAETPVITLGNGTVSINSTLQNLTEIVPVKNETLDSTTAIVDLSGNLASNSSQNYSTLKALNHTSPSIDSSFNVTNPTVTSPNPVIVNSSITQNITTASTTSNGSTIELDSNTSPTINTSIPQTQNPPVTNQQNLVNQSVLTTSNQTLSLPQPQNSASANNQTAQLTSEKNASVLVNSTIPTTQQTKIGTTIKSDVSNSSSLTGSLQTQPILSNLSNETKLVGTQSQNTVTNVQPSANATENTIVNVTANTPTNTTIPFTPTRTTQFQPLINFVKNGNFQTHTCPKFPCVINSSSINAKQSLSSWIPQSYMEVGLVNSYNPSVKTEQDNLALHLGVSTKSSCVKQALVGLTNQYYDLSFDYAPALSQPSNTLSEAFFIVKFNGRNVKSVLCVDSNTHKQNVVVKGIKGENIIEFCSFGSSNSEVHGSIIDNVSLTIKSNLSDLKTDFITNGDFEDNTCSSSSCLWNKTSFSSRYLKGWTPEPEVQVGKGTTYNSHAGISTVASLSPNSNSCIMQFIENCVQGSFKLEFSWAARESQALYGSVFQVKINEKIVQSYISNDYMMHRQIVVLDLKQGKNELKFCSYGANNNKGTVIDDVRMYLINSCNSFSQLQGMSKV